MKKSKRLDPVVRIAGTREKEAARLLGECQQRLSKHEQRLIELIGYRKQYSEQFYRLGSAGVPAQKVNEYKTFLARLGEGIEQQKQRLVQTRRELEQKKRDWLIARGKIQAMNKVVDRHVERENYEAARKEQKETDDQPRRTPDRFTEN